MSEKVLKKQGSLRQVSKTPLALGRNFQAQSLSIKMIACDELDGKNRHQLLIIAY